jgi:nicotinate-nucleotide adenylyltransferase
MDLGRVIAVFGGSFDPVHNGHVGVAHHVIDRLAPDALRIIPAGNPWQKKRSLASAEHRIAMLRCAFASLPLAVEIDEQEVRRDAPTYTIDTVQALRAELGDAASVVFIIGADQLAGLHTWRQWRQLFEHVHLFAVSRPGWTIDAAGIDAEVIREFMRRGATLQQMRTAPHGLTTLSAGLAIDISSTEVRRALHDRRHQHLDRLLPDAVLDYIQQHHLYQG